MGWGETNARTAKGLAAACAALLLLSACARSEGPAPVTYGSSSSTYQPGAATGSQTAQRPLLPQGGVHVVRRGESLYSISRGYGVPLRSLIDANSLRPPYTLLPGQSLSIPRAKVHTVQRGDTVYSLSKRYDVSMTELTRANGLGPPYDIQVGQQLTIPAPGSSSTPAPLARAPQPQAAPAPAEPSQTAESAAQPPLPQEKPLQSGDSQAAAVTAKPKPAPLPPPPGASGRFSWPLQGRILSGFGAKDGGYFNDGVNIEAPAGATVRAAENGVVVYAGSELKGFGRLLLVKHSGGWVTAYAHNARLLVSRGQTVTKGQEIALVGATGNVDRPQLHFELRKGSDAVDPMKHLPALQSAVISD
jgi:murein DD-endopeptidase MepM/ murein hydrolase activator NlpD